MNTKKLRKRKFKVSKNASRTRLAQNREAIKSKKESGIWYPDRHIEKIIE